ncbi:MAG: hypothetical protein ACJ8AI_23205 [Rhodopila sp.]
MSTFTAASSIGELQMLLMAAVQQRLGPQAVLTGHHLVSSEEMGASVRAYFTDPRSETLLPPADGTLLIAADGIHSTVRSRLYPNEDRRSGMAPSCGAAPRADGRSWVAAQ